jgi:DNA invertase Pin-like site-specific DNA recombinase
MPAGKAMFQIMGVFAEFERAMVQERARARAGKGQERRQAPRPPAELRRYRASYQIICWPITSADSADSRSRHQPKITECP